MGFPSLCQGILLAKFLRRTIAEFDWIRWVIDRTEHSGGFFAAARLPCSPSSAMRAHGAAVFVRLLDVRYEKSRVRNLSGASFALANVQHLSG